MKKNQVQLTGCTKAAGWAAKISPGDLDRVLTGISFPTDERVLIGTATADDAGVYKISDELALIQTLDFFPPIVDDPYDFGRIAAANALSDVYAMGGIPKTALNIVAYPIMKMDRGMEHLPSISIAVVTTPGM